MEERETILSIDMDKCLQFSHICNKLIPTIELVEEHAKAGKPWREE
jgi:hypothetical protein